MSGSRVANPGKGPGPMINAASGGVRGPLPVDTANSENVAGFDTVHGACIHPGNT